MSTIEEFETILQELPTLKAPGVSGTRIKKLTDIAVKNVADESKLIASLYSSCKATPSSHKLGVLYVVDSIVRVYMDEAKKKNESIDGSAPEGTFGAGVHRISELVEPIVDDAMELTIVPATKVKIGKLIDIWERASTFTPETLGRIREKHFKSRTPPGSPVGRKTEAALPPPPPSTAAAPAPATDAGNILSTLASLAKKTETPPTGSPAPQPAAPAQNNANNILSQLSVLAGTSGTTPPVQSPPVSQAQTNQPGSKEYIFNMLQQMQGQGQGQGQGSQPPAPVPGMPPVPNMQNLQGQTGTNMNSGYAPPNQGFQGPNQGFQGMNQGQNYGNQGYQAHGQGHNQNYGGQGMHGNYNDRRGRDDGGYSRRNRSRSPSGRYDRYGNSDNGHRGNQQGFMQPPQQEINEPGNPNYRPRNTGFDNTLPQGSFKVLSRTLFIGGVPRGMDERQLASHLKPYAEVQSTILNSERKHAFVKVYSRKEAENVLQSFNKDGALPLRTRWGVGFGPRDCCNYQHGISIIPIQRLTDADRQWVVSAQWGGTGGEPLVSGIVIDEPDIEIGTGISSKAMSRKMPTNSTRNGPKSNRPGESEDSFAKTSNSGNQDFISYASGSNPLTGLFANQPPQMNPQNNGYPPQNNGYPPQSGYPPPGNYGGPPNANIGAQLANFFQNGAPR